MINNSLYKQDIEYTASLCLPWERLHNKAFLITGASGLIGSFLVDTIMYKNKSSALNCKIYAVGRNAEKAKSIFGEYLDTDEFEFISQDINKPFTLSNIGDIDYMLHLASNTHPIAYASDPIGTISSNIIGTYNLLELACEHNTGRFAFASSNEIYGENRGDVEFFDENYCGYINSNTMRAGYPESKRCGEALCQAYIKQKGLDIVIPRLTRSFGPTMLMSDTKAISQFIRKSIAGEDIVLKSEGNQYYSYTYVSDAVSGILTILLKGECGAAYNIADEKIDITLKDLAKCIAEYSQRRVIFELPDELERSGYSTATKARLDGSRLRALGWEPKYDIYSGINRTLDILTDK